MAYTEQDWTAILPSTTKTKLQAMDAGIKTAQDTLDLETVAGKAMTQAANAAAQVALLPDATASADGKATAEQIAKLDGIEAGADVTDKTNVAAAIESGAETTAPADTDIAVGVKSDHTLLYYTWLNIWKWIMAKIHAATAKDTPIDADSIAGIDSSASNVVTRWTFANLWVWVQAKIHGAVNKDALVDADKFAIIDTEASNVVKTTTYSNLKTKIKALFGFVANVVGFEFAGGTTSKKLIVDANASTSNIPAAAPTATPTASRVPIADGSGKLNGWVSDSAVGTKGKVALAADGGTTAGTAVQANDARLQTAPTTWTPVPKFGTSNDDGAFVVSENLYTKSGKKVHLEGSITWTAKGSKTGFCSIIGVPVASGSGSARVVGTAVITTGGADIASTIIVLLNASILYLYTQGPTGYVTITNAAFTDTTNLRLSVDYIAA